MKNHILIAFSLEKIVSLFTGTDDEDHEYDCLGAWGPRFDKLANMYGPEQGQEIDDL